MATHYHPAGSVDEAVLAEEPLRVELYGRRFIRSGRSWRVFVGDNQTHNHRPVCPADAAYLEQRFPRGNRQ